MEGERDHDNVFDKTDLPFMDHIAYTVLFTSSQFINLLCIIWPTLVFIYIYVYEREVRILFPAFPCMYSGTLVFSALHGLQFVPRRCIAQLAFAIFTS